VGILCFFVSLFLCFLINNDQTILPCWQPRVPPVLVVLARNSDAQEPWYPRASRASPSFRCVGGLLSLCRGARMSLTFRPLDSFARCPRTGICLLDI
jgi:hypothetical protein